MDFFWLLLSVLVAIFEQPVLTTVSPLLTLQSSSSLLKLYTNSLSSFHILELFQALLFMLLPLSSLLFNSSQLLWSDYICKLCCVHITSRNSWFVFQLTRSPKYLKDHAHCFFSQKEKKSTFKQWFLTLTCFTDTLKGSFPEKYIFQVENCAC